MKHCLVALAAAGLFLLASAARADYFATVIADAPVAYYRLDDLLGSLTAADSSGNGLGGLYFGGVLLGQPGAFVNDADTAVLFDGVNAHVRVLNPVSDNFSIEFWMNTSVESLTGSQTYQGTGIVWSDVAGTANDWIVGYLNNVASFFTGNPDDTINGTTPLNNGVWHHIVATRALGGAKNLYVDGQLENTGFTNSNLLNANPVIEIGGNTLDRRYFTGGLDEVAIYTVELTPDQVLAHYNAGLGR